MVWYRVCIAPCCIFATIFCVCSDEDTVPAADALPGPEMSTSPSGLTQGAHVRESHPQSVKQFDILLRVREYINSLGATFNQFKPIDFGHQRVR